MFQKDTYISIDCLNRDAEVYVKNEAGISRIDVKVERESEPLRVELQSFVRAIRDDQEPKVTGEEGFRALELALEIQGKMKDRMKRVRIP